MDPLNKNMEGLTEEQAEDCLREMIYQNAQPVTDGGGEDDGGEDFSSQFLNNSGEGAELEKIRDDDEVPLAHSDAVCIYIKSLLITRCIN